MPTSEKTLLEHHYELRIGALQDDPRVDYAKRLIVVELMAATLGWKYLCPMEAILNRVEDIYHA